MCDEARAAAREREWRKGVGDKRRGAKTNGQVARVDNSESVARLIDTVNKAIRTTVGSELMKE